MSKAQIIILGIGWALGQSLTTHFIPPLNRPAIMSQSRTGLLAADDPLFILYTGGTTGESKGALHSHLSAYFGMLNQTVAEGIGPNSVYMLTGQMFHIPVLLAVNYTAHGCPVVLMNFDAELALRLIETERVSGLSWASQPC